MQQVVASHDNQGDKFNNDPLPNEVIAIVYARE